MVSVNAASGFLLSLAAQKQRGKGHHTTTTQHLFPAAPVVLPRPHALTPNGESPISIHSSISISGTRVGIAR